MPELQPGSGLERARPRVHPNHDHQIGPWLDEEIWGHRLWDSQTPWLVLLEFLTVAQSKEQEGALFADAAAYPLTFQPAQRLYLRNILFNSEDVLRVASDHPDSRTAWDVWLARMVERARGVADRDFSYLRARFHTFAEFAQVVRLLQGAALERARNKRWSSRFLFPFGPDALYEDLNVGESGTTVSREYINFGRTGEILYLMASRSSRSAELADAFAPLLDGRNRWNRLVALLQPPHSGDRLTRGKSYLPYDRHPSFDLLVEDWIALIRLGLPGFDVYPHLATIGALHLVLYQLRTAAGWADVRRPGVSAPEVQMVCEIVAPRKTLVRDTSLASYAKNDALSTRAIERFIDEMENSDEWGAVQGRPDAFVESQSLLQRWVWWGQDYNGPGDPDAIIEALRVSAVQRHRKHVAQFHRSLGREIGLVSRRGTTRYRYAPTDQLLRTLLFANVERRMELGEFLARLHARYGLVIGEAAAELVLESGDFDKKAFQANARRLEERLASLGLLRRLSDACAYVINPYSPGESDVGQSERLAR